MRTTKCIAAAMAALMLVACSDDDGDGMSTRAVTVTFEPTVAGQVPACNGQYLASVGDPVVDYQLVEYRWYASDFHLRTASGDATPILLDDRGDGLQYQGETHNVSLLGFVSGCDTGDAEPASNFTVTGTVPEGDYAELCFTLGVPFDLNHSDPTAGDTPSPLNLPAMNWNWKGGRKFVRFDGFGDPNGVNNRFNLHLGSTGCDSASATEPPSEPCGAPNTPTYCFALGASAQYTPQVSVDPARVLDEVDIRTNTEGTAAGCMSFIDDPECETIMPKYGLSYSLNGSTVPAGTPSLFQ